MGAWDGNRVQPRKIKLKFLENLYLFKRILIWGGKNEKPTGKD